MIHRKTVFVVGAGASKEVGLPIGSELTTEISALLDIKFSMSTQKLSGDDAIWIALRNISTKSNVDINHYLRNCSNVSNAMALTKSIDTYVDNHQGNDFVKLCAKLAIARAISGAEKKSSLAINGESMQHKNLDFHAISDTWYRKSWNIMQSGVRQSDIGKIFNNGSFIIFNYDRCVEQFLYHAIQTSFQTSASDAADIVSSLKIFHPYGVIGDFGRPDKGLGLPFGCILDQNSLIQSTDKILTFSETQHDAAMMEAITRVVTEAENIIFLGFSYHQQNMKLLVPNNQVTRKSIFGTALHEKDDAENMIKSQLADFFGTPLRNEIHRDLTCSDLFDHFGRRFESQ